MVADGFAHSQQLEAGEECILGCCCIGELHCVRFFVVLNVLNTSYRAHPRALGGDSQTAYVQCFRLYVPRVHALTAHHHPPLPVMPTRVEV